MKVKRNWILHITQAVIVCKPSSLALFNYGSILKQLL